MTQTRFKEQFSFEQRKNYFEIYLEKYEDKIQIIVETNEKSTLPFLSQM